MTTDIKNASAATFVRYNPENGNITVAFRKAAFFTKRTSARGIVTLISHRTLEIIGFRLLNVNACRDLQQRWHVLKVQSCNPSQTMLLTDILDAVREDLAYGLDLELFKELKSKSAGLECDLSQF